MLDARCRSVSRKARGVPRLMISSKLTAGFAALMLVAIDTDLDWQVTKGHMRGG